MCRGFSAWKFSYGRVCRFQSLIWETRMPDSIEEVAAIWAFTCLKIQGVFYLYRSALCGTTDVHMWKTWQNWNELDVMYGLLVHVRIQVYNIYVVKPVFLDQLDTVHTETYRCNMNTVRPAVPDSTSNTWNMYNLFENCWAPFYSHHLWKFFSCSHLSRSSHLGKARLKLPPFFLSLQKEDCSTVPGSWVRTLGKTEFPHISFKPCRFLLWNCLLD